MGFRAAASGGVLVGLLAISLIAQHKPPAAPQTAAQKPAARFQTRVELVTLDVSVLDRDRCPVRGLTAADFIILEDGKPQPIQTLSEVDIPDVEEAPAPWVRAVAPDVRRNDDLDDRRIIALVLDDALPIDLQRAWVIPLVKQKASEVIERLGPRDLAAVVFPLDKSNGQDFTDDRARLLKAIEKYHGGQPDLPGEAPGIVATRHRFLYDSLGSTIRMLAESLAEVPQRRKSLILVSEGIPLDATELAPRVGLSDGNDTGGILREVVGELNDTFAAAQRANVNIYSLNPAGLDPSAFNTKADFLRGIAETTGGFAIVDTNDPRPEITQIFRESSSYYLLGYTPANAHTDGRFRKVEVRVNRPGLTIRARTGYFEPTREKPATPASVPPPSAQWKALASLLPKGAVAMQVVAAPFAIPDRPEVAVAIATGLRQPAPARADRIVENLDLLINAYDPKGDRRGTTRLNARVTLRPQPASNIGYEVVTRLDLKPGRYQLRLAASSSMEGKAGSVFCDVDVPDFSKGGLSLSGALVTLEDGLPSAPKNPLAGLVLVVPTTVREFVTTDRATAFVRVYQPGRDPLAPVAIGARFLDGTGAVVFDTTRSLGPEAFQTARAADYRLDLPLAQLKRGLHLLTITATAGKRTASRDVRFAVK